MTRAIGSAKDYQRERYSGHTGGERGSSSLRAPKKNRRAAKRTSDFTNTRTETGHASCDDASADDHLAYSCSGPCTDAPVLPLSSEPAKGQYVAVQTRWIGRGERVIPDVPVW